jgi:carboxyl-terminal processing protease
MKAIPSLITILSLVALAATGVGQEWNAGVGLALGIEGNAITILEVLPDTPAAKAGITAGQRIMEIDGIGTGLMTIEQCVKLIRGPVGTTVKLKLKDPFTGDKKTVDLKRQLLPR